MRTVLSKLAFILLTFYTLVNCDQCPVSYVTGPDSLSIDYCFKLYGPALNWITAQGKCAANNGGNLVSVANAFENNFFLSLIQDTQIQPSSVYLGGYYSTTGWMWVDGTPFTYTNWDSGEPSVYKDGCVYIDPQSGKWLTSTCDTKYPYMCEIGTLACVTKLPKCEDGWEFYNGTKSCYKVERGDYWADAEKKCTNVSAHLTSVHSSEEGSFIATKLTNPNETESCAWIGGFSITSAENDTLYFWTDGSPFDWKPKGFDNFASSSTTCLQANQTNKWSAQKCDDEKKPFVCKKAANV